MTGKSVSSGSSDSMPSEIWYIQLKVVERFIEPDVVASRLEKLKPQGQNESQFRALKAFQQALDRRRSGKPDSNPYGQRFSGKFTSGRFRYSRMPITITRDLGLRPWRCSKTFGGGK